jgi:hypothetical protein
LYSCDTLLKRLAQDVQDMAAALRPLIQEADPMVRPRHLARHGHLAAPNPPDSGDGMMGSPTRARGDQGSAGACMAGDVVEVGGVKRFG